MSLFFSFYGIIIVNFVFFVSTIFAYVLSPVYHGLGADDAVSGIAVVVAFVQVILATPLIEFFIFFIAKSVLSLFESIITIVPGLGIVWQISFLQAHGKSASLRHRNENFGLCKEILRF